LLVVVEEPPSKPLLEVIEPILLDGPLELNVEPAVVILGRPNAGKQVTPLQASRLPQRVLDLFGSRLLRC
jgi:hypothetical protein